MAREPGGCLQSFLHVELLFTSSSSLVISALHNAVPEQLFSSA